MSSTAVKTLATQDPDDVLEVLLEDVDVVQQLLAQVELRWLDVVRLQVIRQYFVS